MANMIVGKLGWVTIFSAELVNAAASVESDPIKIEYQGGAISILIQATSAGGTPSLQVQVEECDSENGSYVVPEDIPEIFPSTDPLADENRHIKSVSVDPADWMKIKITGTAAVNPADTLVTAKLFFGG